MLLKFFYIFLKINFSILPKIRCCIVFPRHGYFYAFNSHTSSVQYLFLHSYVLETTLFRTDPVNISDRKLSFDSK